MLKYDLIFHSSEKKISPEGVGRGEEEREEEATREEGGKEKEAGKRPHAGPVSGVAAGGTRQQGSVFICTYKYLYIDLYLNSSLFKFI